jgi:hypothetical protein
MKKDDITSDLAGGRIGQGTPSLQLTARLPSRWQRIHWAGARMAFLTYIGFSLFSVVGGFLTAPLVIWSFFDDWRFWRHFRRAAALYPHGWRLLGQTLRGERTILCGVPLTSAPQSAPSPEAAVLSPTWPHGSSCGPCNHCCQLLRCPVLDLSSIGCSGYNSFFWRYFNCGRYPSSQREIESYGCPKWLLDVPLTR